MIAALTALAFLASIEPFVPLVPGACAEKAVHVKPTPVRAALVECNCDREFYPAGTRIYAYDTVVVKDRGTIAAFPANARVVKACGALDVSVPGDNPATAYHFDRDARAYLRKRALLTAVRPGHAMPAKLKRAIASGEAYYLRTVQ